MLALVVLAGATAGTTGPKALAQRLGFSCLLLLPPAAVLGAGAAGVTAALASAEDGGASAAAAALCCARPLCVVAAAAGGAAALLWLRGCCCCCFSLLRPWSTGPPADAKSRSALSGLWLARGLAFLCGGGALPSICSRDGQGAEAADHGGPMCPCEPMPALERGHPWPLECRNVIEQCCWAWQTRARIGARRFMLLMGKTHLVACWTLGSGCFCHTLISDLPWGWLIARTGYSMCVLGWGHGEQSVL